MAGDAEVVEQFDAQRGQDRVGAIPPPLARNRELVCDTGTAPVGSGAVGSGAVGTGGQHDDTVG